MRRGRSRLVAGAIGVTLVTWTTLAMAGTPASWSGIVNPGMLGPVTFLAGIDVGIEIAAQVFAWASGHVRGILVVAYERAPTLVTVLAALLIIPLVALVVLLASALRVGGVTRPSLALAGQPRNSETTFRPGVATGDAAVTPWPQRAWLAVEGQAAVELPRAQGLVRIGRGEDNDIRLPFATVHRHHALVHRTPEGAYILMDLSGADGNGLLVNDEKRIEALLVHGDVVRIGDVRLRFESTPV